LGSNITNQAKSNVATNYTIHEYEYESIHINKYNSLVCVSFSNFSICLINDLLNEHSRFDEQFWKEIYIRNAITANLKTVSDTGYILPMAVELAKVSLPFGSPICCVLIESKKLES